MKIAALGMIALVAVLTGTLLFHGKSAAAGAAQTVRKPAVAVWWCREANSLPGRSTCKAIPISTWKKVPL